MHRCARCLSFASLLMTIAGSGCGGSDDKPRPDATAPVDTGVGGSNVDGPASADRMSGDAPATDGPAPDGAVATGMVQGRLFVAGTAMPIAGGTVRAPGGLSATSDAQGAFQLPAVPAGTVVLQASGPSLSPTVKPVSVTASQPSYVELFLSPADAQGAINAQSGGEIKSGTSGARAQFAPNSLVDRDGNMVQGMVQVSLSSIDPSRPEELRAFPGAFRAIRTDAQEVAIETFGPMEISVTKDGQRLDLMSGTSAEIAFPIYDPAAPATIELWSLNETTGVWKEEGLAYRTEDDQGHPIYRARIGHMSWWNPDRPIERTCVRTCVTSNGAPVPGATVTGLGVGYGYEVTGFTGSDGCVSLRVQRNRQVTLRAAALGGVSAPVLAQAPASPEPADPAACTVVSSLSLADRPADGCPAGLTRCGERCVDLAGNPDNCGACGTVCGDDVGPDRSSCVMGVCACSSNQITCNGACVDPSSDRWNCGGCSATGPSGAAGLCEGQGCCGETGLTACPVQGRFLCTNTSTDSSHCGSCDTSCSTGQECKNGACTAIVCPAGQTLCGSRCIEGLCGKTCDEGQTCSAGACQAIVCADPLKLCGNTCVDTRSDARNCGSCDNACPNEGAVCTGGTCGCAAGSAACAIGSEVTACVNLASDRYNCGTCGNICPQGTICSGGQCNSVSCPQGQILCGDRCVDVKTDATNCGGCSGSGGGGDGMAVQVCDTAACQCPSGYVVCAYGERYTCVNPATDDRNCGECGVACDSGTRCISGSCQTITCPQGSTLCNGQCVAGSSCGQDCTADGGGQVCVGGSCQCPAGWQLCEGVERSACRDTSSDSRNCGGCNKVCGNGLECREGQCQAVSCPAGQIWCGSCVDPNTDPGNCGGCTPSPRAGLGCGGAGCCEKYGLVGCGFEGTNSYACTTLSSDAYNCGSCRNVCPDDQVCREGQCQALVCPVGQAACNHECVLGTTCGKVCYDGQSCSAGTCQ